MLSLCSLGSGPSPCSPARHHPPTMPSRMLTANSCPMCLRWARGRHGAPNAIWAPCASALLKLQCHQPAAQRYRCDARYREGRMPVPRVWAVSPGRSPQASHIASAASAGPNPELGFLL